jgi:16S rRNA U1498 N3-methylase RsmE
MARHQPHVLLRNLGSGGAVEVDAETRHHLEKVLRYPDGGAVSYTDGAGLIGAGSWQSGAIVRGEERRSDRPPALTVAVAPPHNTSRVRFLVEKMGELAVDRLLWLKTVHGEGRAPRQEKAAGWARAALEQSRGAWLIEIGGPVTVAELNEWGSPVFAEWGGSRLPPEIADPVLCIGPEGGFAPDEIPVRAPRLHLGDTVLRVETAAIVGSVLLRTGRPRVE